VKATTFQGERTSKNLAFVDAVARKNIELTMAHIREKSEVLRELESKKNVRIAGAMYNLKTAAVEFFA
jgi:carbonic anhydrase